MDRVTSSALAVFGSEISRKKAPRVSGAELQSQCRVVHQASHRVRDLAPPQTCHLEAFDELGRYDLNRQFTCWLRACHSCMQAATTPPPVRMARAVLGAWCRSLSMVSVRGVGHCPWCLSMVSVTVRGVGHCPWCRSLSVVLVSLSLYVGLCPWCRSLSVVSVSVRGVGQSPWCRSLSVVSVSLSP